MTGRRSQERKGWPKRHDTPMERQVRVWVCAECKTRGCQLIRCDDGKQRCPKCKEDFDQQRETPLAAAYPVPLPIVPAGQLVHPPRVG